MGIDGTNNSNRLARAEAFKRAQTKSDSANTKPETKEDLSNNSKKPSLFSNFKSPAFVSNDDKAQAAKSSVDIGDARGSEDLDTAWASASKSSDRKFDPISVESPEVNNFDDSTLSALSQIEEISDNAIERSGLLNISFDLEENQV